MRVSVERGLIDVAAVSLYPHQIPLDKVFRLRSFVDAAGPIVIDDGGALIEGLASVLVARLDGVRSLPYLRGPKLSEKQKIRMRVFDNAKALLWCESDSHPYRASMLEV